MQFIIAAVTLLAGLAVAAPTGTAPASGLGGITSLGSVLGSTVGSVTGGLGTVAGGIGSNSGNGAGTGNGNGNAAGNGNSAGNGSGSGNEFGNGNGSGNTVSGITSPISVSGSCSGTVDQDGLVNLAPCVAV